MNGIGFLGGVVNQKSSFISSIDALAASPAMRSMQEGEFDKFGKQVFRGPAPSGSQMTGSKSIDKDLESVLVLLMSVLEQMQKMLLTVTDRDAGVTPKTLGDKADSSSAGVVVPIKVPSDSQISGISDKAVGRVPDDIWFGLIEGNGSNSGILASIKAAMLKFGQNPRSIYTSVTEAEGVYQVVMKDGYKVTLTQKELEKARLFADFSGRDSSMVQDATFMYAVSAKRAQTERLLGIPLPQSFSQDPFERAMQSLNHNCWASRALPYLGLSAHMREMPAAELARTGGVGVVTYNYDAMLMVDGDIDMYGPEKYVPDYVKSIVSTYPRPVIALI